MYCTKYDAKCVICIFQTDSNQLPGLGDSQSQRDPNNKLKAADADCATLKVS